MSSTLDSFLSPSSPKKRPPSPSSNSPRKNPRTATATASASGKAAIGEGAGKAGSSGSSGASGQKGDIEELVLDDSDDDDLIIVEPVAGPSSGVTGAGNKKSGGSKSGKVKKEAKEDTSTPKKTAPPVAALFQKRPPASPAAGSSKGDVKGKGKVKKEKAEDEGSEEEHVTGKGKVKAEDSDVKPDVKPSLASPLKTISIFNTTAASTSASASSSAASTSDAVLLKPLNTPLFSFDPQRDVSFPLPPGAAEPPVPFSFFTSALLLISSTKSRLIIRLVLTNLLRTIIVHSPSSLLAILYLLSNRIAPSYARGVDLGVGWQVLSKAIKETSGITAQKLKQLGTLGDPGDIAYEASRTVRMLVRPKELTCEGVYATLHQIAKLKGTGVLATKTALVKKLLLSARGEEVRYVVRILVANLRIGAVRLSLLTALARAFCLARPGGVAGGAAKKEEEGDSAMDVDEDDSFWVTDAERSILAALEEPVEQEGGSGSPSKGTGKGKAKKVASKPASKKTTLEVEVEARFAKAEKTVRRVYARHPNLDHLVVALKEAGVGGIEERIGVSVGIPLEPMLGSITRSLADVYTKLGNRPFVSESKLDGQRGQIHVFVTDIASSTSARPDGVEIDSGLVYQGEPLKGLEGRRVWVRTFSRHLEEMSQKYPDICGTMAAMVARSFVNATPDSPPLTNFILDCEVVALDPVTGAYKTFQELSYRSKKDVELGDIKVRVGVFAFDLMFLNDESLLSSPFRRRRNLLRTLFPPLRPTDPRLAKFELIPSCDDTDPEAVREFFEECVRSKAEGIMVKLLDEVEVEVEVEGDGDVAKGEGGEEAMEEADEGTAEEEDIASGNESGTASGSGSGKEAKAKGKAVEGPAGQKGKGRKKVLPATYEPDKRADSWLKVKKDYLDELGDSLDLVPIAGWHGTGRKAGWWSPFLLGCWDEDSGTYVAVTKCLSGFTDAFYKEYKVKYSEDPENPLTSKTCWPEVDGGGLTPAIWFKPSEVWEIRGADFTLSPVYTAARSLLGNERGVSIRFPRFIKVRDDKAIENATTAEQLAELFEKQAVVAPAKQKAVVEEE